MAMKRLIELYLFLFFGILCVTGCRKEEYPTSGKDGALKWTLMDGTLTISGKGAMPNYSVLPTEYLPEWFELRKNIISVVIGDDVTNIGDYAFFRCENMTSITIGDSVTSIGRDAFSGCSNLTSVTMPNSVTNIGYGAFFDCSALITITISNSATSIGDYAFANCGLTTISIPNSTKSIGEYAFLRCKNMTSATIGNSVTGIGIGVFFGCSALTEIINYQEKPQAIYSSVFGNVDRDKCTLYVPVGSIDAYRSANVWGSFLKMGIIDDVGSVAAYRAAEGWKE